MIHPKKLCQLEMHSQDTQASVKFFTEFFGWPAVPISIHEYTVLAVPEDSPFGVSIVGHRPQEHHPTSSGVVPYFAYEDEFDRLLAKAIGAGGRLLWGPRLVPGYGQVYLVEDPGGIRLGIYRVDAEPV